jgi:hypothetical protein
MTADTGVCVTIARLDSRTAQERQAHDASVDMSRHMLRLGNEEMYKKNTFTYLLQEHRSSIYEGCSVYNVSYFFVLICNF